MVMNLDHAYAIQTHAYVNHALAYAYTHTEIDLYDVLTKVESFFTP